MLKNLKPITIILTLLIVSWIALLSVKSEAPATIQTSPTPINPQEKIASTLESLPMIGASETPAVNPVKLPTATLIPEPTGTTPPQTTATAIATSLPAPTPIRATVLPPDRWKDWPVMPAAVSDTLRKAYQNSLALGTIDPHAFSIFGDCQGEADAYMGVFDSSPGLVKTISQDLQEFVNQFSGSFNRYNPAAKSGSSAGSLLFAPWNDNKEGKCLAGEIPVDCELRVHRPSIVFIQLGTHFETPERNYLYLATIIEKVLATGAVPVIVTKADNLEKNEFVNRNIADLAAKYELPLWNFWSSVQNLPSQGLESNGMHLTKAGVVVHQVTALRVLGSVWQSLK